MSPNNIYSAPPKDSGNLISNDLVSSAIAHALSITPSTQRLLTAVSRRDEIKPQLTEHYEKTTLKSGV